MAWRGGTRADAYSAGREHALAGPVGDSQAAAKVQMAKRDAAIEQFARERGDQLGGLPDWFRPGDLRSDVRVQADDLQVRALHDVRDQGARGLDGHAELGAVMAGRDVRMAERIHVGIDPHRHARAGPVGRGHGFDPLDLARRLRVDRLHAQLDSQGQLRLGLADAGEHDLVGREPRAEGDLDLSAGVRIGVQPEAVQQPADGQCGIRLQGVVALMRVGLERAVERTGPLRQNVAAVDMDRRPRRACDLVERHAVAGEDAILDVEAGHRTQHCIRLRRVPAIIAGSPAPMAPDHSPASSSEIDVLIARCLDGDQTAWEQVVRQHWRKVFNLAYKFVGRHDEAEDLTQDIFVKIFKALHTFDRRANFQTWLISISRNLCIDHYRSVRKERETIAREVDPAVLAPASHDRGPYAALEQRDLRQLISRALSALPQPLRQAVTLRDLQDFSYQEIADRLGLPEGTVKSRINRGRLELARQLRRLQSAKPADRSVRRGGSA